MFCSLPPPKTSKKEVSSLSSAAPPIADLTLGGGLELESDSTTSQQA